jgi:serine/threonine protein kinase
VKDFDLLKVVGRGNFGKVMQVRKVDTGRVYAMKVLRKDTVIAADAIKHTLSEVGFALFTLFLPSSLSLSLFSLLTSLSLSVCLFCFFFLCFSIVFAHVPSFPYSLCFVPSSLSLSLLSSDEFGIRSL